MIAYSLDKVFRGIVLLLAVVVVVQSFPFPNVADSHYDTPCLALNTEAYRSTVKSPS